MTTEAKLKLLEELFEVDSGSLTPEMDLGGVAWDSMAHLAFIALVNENFHKIVSAQTLKKIASVQEILDIME